MRTIMAAALILISVYGFSQSNFQVNKKGLQYRNGGKTIVAPHYYKKNTGKFFPLPDSGRKLEIATLPPDSMLFIIPGKRIFYNMPNAAKPVDLALLNQKLGAIPNPLFNQSKQDDLSILRHKAGAIPNPLFRHQRPPKVKPFTKPDTNKEGS